MAMKRRKLIIAWTLLAAVAASAAVPRGLHRRWELLNPTGNCGPCGPVAPTTIVKFGRDGFMRTYLEFGDDRPTSKDGHGDPVRYSVSGDRLRYEMPGGLVEVEYVISGERMTMRVVGEWMKNYVFYYRAE